LVTVIDLSFVYRWEVRRHNQRQRRYSDGGEPMNLRRPYDYHHHHQQLQMTPTAALMKYGTTTGGRRSRSWDPSPSPTPNVYLGGGGVGDDGYGGYGGYGDYADDYGGDYESMAAAVLDDEHDEELQREEKKARIKAEIARRRRQIEDNVRLHEELLRLARIRENAEHEYSSSMLPSLSTAGIVFDRPRAKRNARTLYARIKSTIVVAVLCKTTHVRSSRGRVPINTRRPRQCFVCNRYAVLHHLPVRVRFVPFRRFGQPVASARKTIGN